MKKIPLILVIFVFLFSIAACGSGSDDVAISIGLTQTATAPIETVEDMPEAATGIISGMAGLFAPPTPPLTIYAVNIVSGEWFSIDTPESEMETSYSIEVPAGTYQVIAFPPGLGYSANNQELSTLTVQAGETVADIRLAVPGPSDCGPAFGIPASPDGKYAEVPAGSDGCTNVEEPDTPAPVESELISIQFAAGDDSAQVFGTLPAGGVNHYVLGAAAGQEMTLSIDAFDGNATTIAIAGADGTILNQYDTSSPMWTGVLPKTQEYYIDILSPENVDIDYALVVVITTPQQPAAEALGGITGSINYPEETSPPMHIIITERATGLWYWVGTAENAGAYTMPELPPGSYTVSAYTQSGLVGGYVDSNGSFLPVNVGSSELVENIHLGWWARNGNEVDPVGW